MDETTKEPQGEQKLWLEKELKRWVEENIISNEQAVKLAGLYGIEWAEQVRKSIHNYLITVLALIGAVCVGIGAILFIAANWEEIPRFLRLVMIFGVLAAAYYGVYHLNKKDYKIASIGLLLLCGLLYGAAIWLIAQIFHISANFPLGVLVWALGVFPLSFVNPHISFTLLYVVILTIWTLVFMGENKEAEFFYPLILCVTTIPFAYRRKHKFLLFTIFYGLVVWLFFMLFYYLKYRYEIPFLYSFISLFFLSAIFYLIGFIHSISPQLPRFFNRLSPFADFDSAYQRILPILLPIFLFSFKDIVSEGIRDVAYRSEMSEKPIPLITLIIGIIAFAVLIKSYILLHFSSKRPKLASYELGFFTFTIALLFAFFLNIPYFPKTDYWRELPKEAFPYLVLFNLALFGGSLFFIIVGILKQRTFVLATASLSLIAAILARYFDHFFKLLDRSLFFVIGGVILLGTAFLLERGIRRLKKNLGEVSNE